MMQLMLIMKLKMITNKEVTIEEGLESKFEVDLKTCGLDKSYFEHSDLLQKLKKDAISTIYVVGMMGGILPTIMINKPLGIIAFATYGISSPNIFNILEKLFRYVDIRAKIEKTAEYQRKVLSSEINPLNIPEEYGLDRFQIKI